MATQLDPREFAGFRTFNGLFPKEGPKALAVNCDFSTDTEFDIDLQSAADEAKLQSVQTVYVDNRLNAADMVLTISISNQTILAKANTQGYYPVLAPPGAKYKATMAAGTAITQLQFLNFVMAGIVWAAT